MRNKREVTKMTCQFDKKKTPSILNEESISLEFRRESRNHKLPQKNCLRYLNKFESKHS